jgi:hypothetical protein
VLISAPRPHMVAPTTKREERDRRTESVPSKATIASLSQSDISQMTCEELVHAIRGARMTLLRSDIDEHLGCYDRTTLERLAHLARRCCRNQGY